MPIRKANARVISVFCDCGTSISAQATKNPYYSYCRSRVKDVKRSGATLCTALFPSHPHIHLSLLKLNCKGETLVYTLNKIFRFNLGISMYTNTCKISKLF